MLKLRTALGIFDLGFGVFLMTAVFVTTAMCSLLTNVSHWMDVPDKTSVLVITICSVAMVYIWAYASYGVHNRDESPKIITHALYQWTAFVIVWILLLLLSKISFTETLVCNKGSCPESFWMYNNIWISPEANLTSIMDMSLLRDEIRKALTPKINFDRQWNLSPKIFDESAPMVSALKKPSFNDMNVSSMIILFHIVFYLVIFVYGWFILYSYSVQLESQFDRNKEYNEVEMVNCMA